MLRFSYNIYECIIIDLEKQDIFNLSIVSKRVGEKTIKALKNSIIKEKIFYSHKDICKSGDENLIRNLKIKDLRYAYNDKILNIMIDLGAQDYDKGLLRAVKDNNMNMVKLMIKKGAYDLNLVLYYACAHGNIELSNYLICQGADDFEAGLKGACMSKNYEMVEFMIKYNSNWDYILEYACLSGDIKIFNRICEAIGNSNLTINKQCVINACESGNLYLFGYLCGLYNGFSVKNIDLPEGIDFTSPICRNGNFELLNQIPIKKHYWYYGLLSACNVGNIKIAKIIFEKYDVKGQDGIFAACEYGNMDIVKYLAKRIHIYGILNTCAKEATKGGYLDIIKYMIHLGANNYEEITNNLAINGHIDAVDYMVKKYNIKISTGCFYDVCIDGHINMAKYLLENFKYEFNPFIKSNIEKGKIKKILKQYNII